MKLKKFLIIFLSFLISSSALAGELKQSNNTEFSVFTGMFDFSDDGKKSTLIGIQHQNEDLNRDTFFGNLSPITGIMITADNASYFYTGVEANYKIGAFYRFGRLGYEVGLSRRGVGGKIMWYINY